MTRLFILDAYRNTHTDILGHLPAGSDIKRSFKLVFNKSQEVYDYYREVGNKVHLAITLDFNTIIPHIHLSTSKTEDNVTRYFSYLVEFFKTHKLVANFDLLKYGYYDSSQTKIEVKLEVDSNSMLDEMLCIFQAPLKTTISGVSNKVTYPNIVNEI